MVACIITIQCTYTEYSYFIPLSQLRQLKQKNEWIFYAESLNKLSGIYFAVWSSSKELSWGETDYSWPSLTKSWSWNMHSYHLATTPAFVLLNVDWFLAITVVKWSRAGSPISGNDTGCLIVKEYGLSLI